MFEVTSELNFEHLPCGTEANPASSVANPDWLNERVVFSADGFKLEAAITRLVQLAMRQTNQNVSAAARVLGVSRDYVRYRVQGEKDGS